MWVEACADENYEQAVSRLFVATIKDAHKNGKGYWPQKRIEENHLSKRRIDEWMKNSSMIAHLINKAKEKGCPWKSVQLAIVLDWDAEVLRTRQRTLCADFG